MSPPPSPISEHPDASRTPRGNQADGFVTSAHAPASQTTSRPHLPCATAHYVGGWMIAAALGLVLAGALLIRPRFRRGRSTRSPHRTTKATTSRLSLVWDYPEVRAWWKRAAAEAEAAPDVKDPQP